MTFEQRSAQQGILERVEGSLFQGALGDSYGAAVEVMKLDAILERVGPAGVTDILSYDPGAHLNYAPCEQTGVGVVTDDTCMTMGTLAGLIAARYVGKDVDPIPYIHQAYLRWGCKQAWAKGVDYSHLINKNIYLPDWFGAFCFSSGASKNTIAALNSGTIGAIRTPITIAGKDGEPILGDGCGGMMRVAPVGWFAALGMIQDAYNMGKRMAAITHGGKVAQATSGALAELICYLCLGWNWEAAHNKMLGVLDRDREAADTLKLARIVYKKTRSQVIEPSDFTTISVIPKTIWLDQEDENDPGELSMEEIAKLTNLFAAPAVFVQAMYICASAQRWPGTPEERMKWARTLAVTQDGDSDSVGAIVGNILGAQIGMYNYDRRNSLKSFAPLTWALNVLRSEPLRSWD